MESRRSLLLRRFPLHDLPFGSSPGSLAAVSVSKEQSSSDSASFTPSIHLHANQTMSQDSNSSTSSKWTAPLTSLTNALCASNSPECRPAASNSENQTVDYIIRGCESGATGQCPFDNRALKGPWIRSLGRAAYLVPSLSEVEERLERIVNASAVGAASRCRENEGSDAGVGCSVGWEKSCNTPSGWCLEEKVPTPVSGGLGEVHAALEAIQGTLWATQ